MPELKKPSVLQKYLTIWLKKNEIDAEPFSYMGYSGKKCLAVCASCKAVMGVELVILLRKDMQDEVLWGTVKTLSEQLVDQRKDQIGLVEITYWPRVEYVEPSEYDGEEE